MNRRASSVGCQNFASGSLPFAELGFQRLRGVAVLGHGRHAG